MRILEPGCGSGRLTRILSEAVGPGGLVMALDMSEEMLRRAAQRATLPNTTVRKGSVYEIPSDDGFFDQVICFCAFPHFTRKREALREMARVLRPGGSLCISHLSGRERLNRFHQDTQSVVSGHVLPAGEEMGGMVEAAGLRVEHLKDTDEEFCLHAVKEEKEEKG
jgi:ubiquinone/menaquinone biosynthesis C-methylase UbiE